MHPFLIRGCVTPHPHMSFRTDQRAAPAATTTTPKSESTESATGRWACVVLEVTRVRASARPCSAVAANGRLRSEGRTLNLRTSVQQNLRTVARTSSGRSETFAPNVSQTLNEANMRNKGAPPLISSSKPIILSFMGTVQGPFFTRSLYMYVSCYSQ